LTQIGRMSEREQALFDVIRVLATTMLELGATSAVLRERLNGIRQTAFSVGNAESVKILDRLIEGLFPRPERPLKPPFRIV